MPERIPATPLEKAVLTRPTPEFQDTLIWELVDPQKPDYARLDYGSDHPDTERFSGYKLVKEQAEGYTQNRRWWATNFVLQDPWNYDINYSGESAAHPIYPRVYIQRRDQAPPAVAPLTKGAPFTGVWQIRVTLGGTNYVEDQPPTVTVAAPGGGTTATARAVVNKFGAVVWIVITNEGSGYATAPTVTIAAPPMPGTTATAAASIQLDTAKLVKEDLQELPDDDPRRSIFVRMIRIYETLPGPIITIQNGWDEFGGVETTTEQVRKVPVTPTNEVIEGVPHIQQVLDEDTVKARRRDTLRTVGIVVDDIEQVDLQVTGSKARVEYYLVLASTTIPADSVVAATSSTTYERRRYPKDKNLRVEIKTTYNIPPAYEEDDTGSFTFPTLFYEAYIIANTSFGIIWKRRAGFSKQVVFKHYISFSTAKVTITPDAIEEASWVEPFGFRETALTPASAGHGTLGGPYGRAYYYVDTTGATLDRILPASTPSLETYLASWIGAQKIVGGSSKVWRPGIYRNTIIKVIME